MDKRKALLMYICIIFLSISAGLSHNETVEYTKQIKLLAEAENYAAITEYIDSLRNEGIHTSALSWQYATALYQSGRLNQARDSLLKWEDDSVYTHRVRNMLAQAAVQQKDYMKAVRYLILLSEQNPDNPVFPVRLARVFQAMNQLPAAEARYAYAHKLDSLNQNIIAEWVDVLVKLDFPERANRVLDKGLALSPENFGFRRQKASLAYQFKQYNKVVENAEFLTSRKDTTPQAVKLKAFALFHMDSIERAEFWVDWLINNSFTGEDIWFYKGKILEAQQSKHEAQHYYQLATLSCLSANFNPFALQAGINLFEIGQYQESIRWMQMSRTFSQNPMITFYLALNYLNYYEDKNPALNHFRLFLEQSKTEAQKEHREFARAKIKEITEANHFRGL